MVQKAIDFATKVHEGQYRKGTDRPYIVHPMEVGKIVSTMTQDEEIISAAILHDTIEDCEGVDANVLKEMFSARVAGIVSQESEDKSKTWMERKSATIERLGKTSIEIDVQVTKENQQGKIATICEARFVFVSIKDGKPYPHQCILLNQSKEVLN